MENKVLDIVDVRCNHEETVIPWVRPTLGMDIGPRYLLSTCVQQWRANNSKKDTWYVINLS